MAPWSSTTAHLTRSAGRPNSIERLSRKAEPLKRLSANDRGTVIAALCLEDAGGRP
jgi:hypothetical protein